MKIAYSNLRTSDFRPENQQEAREMHDAVARQEYLARVYILSKNISPGRGYDDRLEQRLRMKRTTIFEMKANGLLQFIPAKGKIMMTERAIQRYEDGLLPMSVLASSDLEAA